MQLSIRLLPLPMPPLSEQIGRRIRDARKSRGMTLESLASECGFTKSYLSKIENSKKVPPIASLSRICTALDARVADLLDDTGSESGSRPRYSVMRSNERQTVIRGQSQFGYDYKSLSHRLARQHMEPFLFTFPELLGEEVYFEHGGEEFVFVISGRVRFFIDGEQVLLETGDAIHFDSALRHRGEAVDGEAKALVVIHSNGR